MSRYTISVFYRTGDSFHSHNETEEVGMSWGSIEKAKLALKYIEEHYKAYQVVSAESWRTVNKFDINLIKDKPWFYSEDEFGLALDVAWQYALYIENDDGEKQRISPFWCGYFEHLHSVEIVVESDPTMKIYF